MCSLTRLYVWVDTAICVSWYSHMCRLIRIYSLKSDAYHVKKRWWQLVRAPRLRSLAFIAREPCREKEGISIKKIPFIALSWHPRFLFYPFELTLSPINIGWAQDVSIEVISELLGHKSIKTTQIYLKSFSLERLSTVNRNCFESVCKPIPKVG